MKGIKVFGNGIKLSQFADDTTLFNADLASLEKALKIVDDFGKLAGLEKTKAIWLGRWASNKNRPLSIKWFHGPVKILGIHFSYDDKGNNELNFNQKIRKLQTKLDMHMWSSRDLTLFGRTMILKSLGLSQLVYSASNLVVPPGTVDLVKTKSFTFLWRNKKYKIKRSGLYQDPDTGGIRMPDLNIMFKVLKLAWITRLMNSVKRKLYLYDLPIFYKTILDNFNELKSLYAYYQKQDIIFFNNKEILVGGKPIFLREWFNKGIILIVDLLDETGNLLTFQEFSHIYILMSNQLSTILSSDHCYSEAPPVHSQRI